MKKAIHIIEIFTSIFIVLFAFQYFLHQTMDYYNLGVAVVLVAVLLIMKKCEKKKSL